MVNIREATVQDINVMVALSDIKRCEYAVAQPQFWQRADNANQMQAEWFKELFTHENCSLYIAEENAKIIGFAIGRVVAAPEVYNPGGMTMMIDDFCVNDHSLWSSVGAKLIDALRGASKEVAQLLVVCGAHDQDKRKFLKEIGLSVASEWYVGK